MQEFKTFNDYRLPIMTSMERLQMDFGSYGTVLQYGEYAIVTDVNYKGWYIAAIYEFVENPGEDGFSAIECRINLVKVADETFVDGGHALEWAIKNCK